MEKKKIIVEKAVILAGLSVIPVVEVLLQYGENKMGISCFYSKKPLAIVISSGSEKKAIRITGEEVPLDQLIQDIPILKQYYI